VDDSRGLSKRKQQCGRFESGILEVSAHASHACERKDKKDSLLMKVRSGYLRGKYSEGSKPKGGDA
jgi:hypothetical protein